MNHCPRCKINICDEALACPLCHGVLQQQTPGNQPFYPDVQPKMKKMVLLIKVVIFVSVLAEGCMLLINYLVDPDFKWSFITGIALFYGCFGLSVSVLHNRSIRRKIVVHLCMGILFMYVLDLLLGYRGWSLSIGAPSAILAVQLVLVVLVIVYHDNWQIYLGLQIMLVLLSIIFFILAITNVIQYKILAYVAVVVCGILLFAMLLFGGRTAGHELKQRFFI
ncbi:MAG: DUF6320 domain-containing protein [Eubacteriales bacterium]|nr:DUF6320 domain-containing protein [Lachnospiraceae bacterium]MDO5126614.1 DUF6320 domain-containing protein [Eubacteriales bacterium]